MGHSDAEFWRRLAAERERAGDFESAVAAYTKLLQLEPTDHASRFRLADTLVFELERHGEALAVLEAAAAYRNANLEYQRGVALDFLERPRDAAAAFEHAFACIDATEPPLWVQPGAMLAEAGNMYQSLEDYATAAQLARRAIASDPTCGRAWEVLGYCADSTKALALAAAALGMAAALDPAKAAHFAADASLAELRADPERARRLAAPPLPADARSVLAGWTGDAEQLLTRAREHGWLPG